MMRAIHNLEVLLLLMLKKDTRQNLHEWCQSLTFALPAFSFVRAIADCRRPGRCCVSYASTPRVSGIAGQRAARSAREGAERICV